MIRAFSYRTCLAAVTLLSAIPAAAQTPQTIDGNLTVTGWGKFNDGIDLGSNADASFNWLAPQTTAFDIVAPSGVFLWRDTITSTPSAKNKMQLDGGNNLTLHKPDGNPGIVLDPSAGKITLPTGTGSGIYFGTNASATLKATADGNPIFSSKVLFENGADFGTGNTLNASNVQFLRGTLGNLGYRETPINATPISSIKTAGDITISRIVNADGL